LKNRCTLRTSVSQKKHAVLKILMNSCSEFAEHLTEFRECTILLQNPGSHSKHLLFSTPQFQRAAMIARVSEQRIHLG